jgi:YidC/Oxa1 family membrane protein insertase
VGFWEVFKNAIFSVINWLYGFSGDWGMAIILITILFRILIFPITAKQFKSSYKMQKMQPKIKEIQEKYADDKVRQQQEMQRIYSEAKFNPISGCLPMLLQMPIFIALYQVLLDLPNLIAGSGRADIILPPTFYSIIPDLAVAAGQKFALTPDGIIGFIPYLILMILFAGSMLVPLLINKTRDKNTLIMTGVMSIMMLFFSWQAPAGVLMYWDTSSILGVVQQYVSKILNDRKAEVEEAAIEIKPIKVEVERKEKKNRPHKNK